MPPTKIMLTDFDALRVVESPAMENPIYKSTASLLGVVTLHDVGPFLPLDSPNSLKTDARRQWFLILGRPGPRLATAVEAYQRYNWSRVEKGTQDCSGDRKPYEESLYSQATSGYVTMFSCVSRHSTRELAHVALGLRNAEFRNGASPSVLVLGLLI
jgi:hypothetical protein